MNSVAPTVLGSKQHRTALKTHTPGVPWGWPSNQDEWGLFFYHPTAQSKWFRSTREIPVGKIALSKQGSHSPVFGLYLHPACVPQNWAQGLLGRSWTVGKLASEMVYGLSAELFSQTVVNTESKLSSDPLASQCILLIWQQNTAEENLTSFLPD